MKKVLFKSFLAACVMASVAGAEGYYKTVRVIGSPNESGHGSGQQTKLIRVNKSEADTVINESEKLLIAVGSFKNVASRRYGYREDNLRHLLESALTQSGRFRVVNRTTLKSLHDELGYSRSGHASGNAGAIRVGEGNAAQFIAEGILTSIDTSSGKQGYRIGPFSTSRQAATVKMAVKISDVTSGEVLFDEDVVGTSSSSGMSIHAGSGSFGRSASEAPIDQAVDDCISRVVGLLSTPGKIDRMANVASRAVAESKVVKVNDDGSVVLGKGSVDGVRKGMIFEVHGNVDEYGIPEDFARIEITFASDKAAKGELIEGKRVTVGSVAKRIN